MLFQTSNTKIQREILTKYLDMEAQIKTGLALEQSKLKQERLNAGRKLDDGICKLDDEVCTLKRINVTPIETIVLAAWDDRGHQGAN